MAFSLELPAELVQARWKVKIRDRERVEPPHATVIRKKDSYRWNLRTRRFMDTDPPPEEVPLALQSVLNAEHGTLVAEWDKMYPDNLVKGDS